MPDINTLMTTYFVNVGDVVHAPVDPGPTPADPLTEGAPVADVAITAATRPETTTGNWVAHHIDGEEFFGALRQEISVLKMGGTDRFFYTNSWCFGLSPGPNTVDIGSTSVTSAWSDQTGLGGQPPFQLQDGSGGPYTDLMDDLAQLAADGVDVRVLAWASPILVNYEMAASKAEAYWALNIWTLKSVIDLRAKPGMEKKVVINTLAHSLASMHLKMVVVGDSIGFRAYVSGLDFVNNRLSDSSHSVTDWHDAGVRIAGEGANAFYKLFQDLWNECLSRSASKFRVFDQKVRSHVDDTPQVTGRTTIGIVGGTKATQILHTLPTMNFASGATARADLSCIKRLVTGFKSSKISFAEDGVFNFRSGMRKAIKNATNYIYIEDQAFQNMELARWLNDELKAKPALKVILLYGGDPMDGVSRFLPTFVDRIIKDVAMPAERVVFGSYSGVVVHTKITIVDDAWAAIGSANCMRRSFYTDGEVSVGVVDEDTPSFAQRLRKDLWGEHCGKAHGGDSDPLLDITQALGLWRAGWGAKPAGFDLKPKIVLMTIPFDFQVAPPLGSWPFPRPDFDSLKYDQKDADSRLEY